jgi:transcription elongation factor Elf1
MDKQIRKYDLSCRICGLGFAISDIKPEIVSVKCRHCGTDAQFFNGVVLQENGEDYFDVYGDVADCSVCNREPEMEFLTIGDHKEHYFAFSCGHYDTDYEDEDEVVVRNIDLEDARLEWNEINPICLKEFLC